MRMVSAKPHLTRAARAVLHESTIGKPLVHAPLTSEDRFAALRENDGWLQWAIVADLALQYIIEEELQGGRYYGIIGEGENLLQLLLDPRQLAPHPLECIFHLHGICSTTCSIRPPPRLLADWSQEVLLRHRKEFPRIHLPKLVNEPLGAWAVLHLQPISGDHNVVLPKLPLGSGKPRPPCRPRTEPILEKRRPTFRFRSAVGDETSLGQCIFPPFDFRFFHL